MATENNEFQVFNGELDKLISNRGQLKSSQDALRILGNKFGDNITIIGSLLKHHLFLSEDIINSVKWVLVQYDSGGKDIGNNMFAISPSYNNQDSVNSEFDTFYGSWETQTKNWLTMTKIINQTWESRQNKPYSHVVLLDNNELLLRLKESGAYKQGQMAIYPHSPVATTYGTVFDVHIYPNDKPVGNWGPYKTAPNGLWVWLKKFNFTNCIYLGINFTDSTKQRNHSNVSVDKGTEPDPVRLWILLDSQEPEVLDKVIWSMSLLEVILEDKFLRDIRQYIIYEDKLFKEMLFKSGSIEFHNTNLEPNYNQFVEQWKNTYSQESLDDILNIIDKKDRDYLNFEKPLLERVFGKNSKVSGKEPKPLDLNGVLFIIAYVVQRKGQQRLNDLSSNSENLPTFSCELPDNKIEIFGSRHNGEMACEEIMALLSLLYKLIEWEDGNVKEKVFALETVISKEGLIEMTFSFDPTKSQKQGRHRSLAQSLSEEYTSRINPEDRKDKSQASEKITGDTRATEASTTRHLAKFLDLVQKSYSDNETTEDGLIFPFHPHISLKAENKKLKLFFGKVFNDIQDIVASEEANAIPRYEKDSIYVGIYDDGRNERVNAFKKLCSSHKLKPCVYSNGSWGDNIPKKFLFILSHCEGDAMRKLRSLDHVVWYSGSGKYGIATSHGYEWPELVLPDCVSINDLVFIEFLSAFRDKNFSEIDKKYKLNNIPKKEYLAEFKILGLD